MSIPKAYQTMKSKKAKGGDSFFKGPVNGFFSPFASSSKFFYLLGLCVFLYTGLRILDYLERYQNPNEIIADIKNIKFNYKGNFAFASTPSTSPDVVDKPAQTDKEGSKSAGINDVENSKMKNSTENASTPPIDSKQDNIDTSKKSNTQTSANDVLKSDAQNPASVETLKKTENKPGEDSTNKDKSSAVDPALKDKTMTDTSPVQDKANNDRVSKDNKDEKVQEIPFFDPMSITSPQDVNILKTLGKRRFEIEKREKSLQRKETDLAILEKRIDDKMKALNEIKDKIEEELKSIDHSEIEKVKSLSKVYTAMKPKEAAMIFEGMDMSLILSISSQMPEKKLSSIIAFLQPERAREITSKLSQKGVSLANSYKAMPTSENSKNPKG